MDYAAQVKQGMKVLKLTKRMPYESLRKAILPVVRTMLEEEDPRFAIDVAIRIYKPTGYSRGVICNKIAHDLGSSHDFGIHATSLQEAFEEVHGEYDAAHVRNEHPQKRGGPKKSMRNRLLYLDNQRMLEFIRTNSTRREVITIDALF